VLVVVGLAAAATGAAASVVVPAVQARSMFSTARGPGMIGFYLFCAAMAG
jgi:hypothetical protein